MASYKADFETTVFCYLLQWYLESAKKLFHNKRDDTSGFLLPTINFLRYLSLNYYI